MVKLGMGYAIGTSKTENRVSFIHAAHFNQIGCTKGDVPCIDARKVAPLRARPLHLELCDYQRGTCDTTDWQCNSVQTLAGHEWSAVSLGPR